jgi:hypothetical protein
MNVPIWLGILIVVVGAVWFWSGVDPQAESTGAGIAIAGILLMIYGAFWHDAKPKSKKFTSKLWED